MTTQSAPLSTPRIDHRVVLTGALSILGLVMLAINFMLAAPLGVAGIVTSILGLRSDRQRRIAYRIFLGISIFTTVMSPLLSLFLLSASRPDPTTSVIPAP